MSLEQLDAHARRLEYARYLQAEVYGPEPEADVPDGWLFCLFVLCIVPIALVFWPFFKLADWWGED